MATISALGTGSGLDLNSLVEQLLQAERAPVENRLNQREERFESQLSALGVFSGALSGLRDAARGLESGRGLAARQAVSSNEQAFTATAREGTAPGQFQVQVLSLAEADKLASGPFESSAAEIGTGTLQFSVGARSFSINIDETNNSLAGIRDAINNAGNNRDVSASIINDGENSRLILTARNTGEENAIQVSASGGDGGLAALTNTDPEAGLTRINEAADAVAVVDGFTVTSASNRIEGAIDGVTLDLVGAQAEGEAPARLTISENRGATLEQVREFVTRYNGFVDVLNGLASYDPETEVAGPLQGNATVRSIASEVRSILTGIVPEAAQGSNTLTAIGITSQEGGTLRIDEGRLNQVIDQRPQALQELFGGDNGLGARLGNYLGDVVGPGSVLEGQSANLQNRLDDIGRQREALEARLERTEQRFVRQFSALDALVAELNQTSAFLSQQFETSNNIGGGRR